MSLQYLTWRICLTYKHTTWFGFIPWLAILLNKIGICSHRCVLCYIVVAPHIHRCVDYYSLIMSEILHHSRPYLWCYYVPGHCDITCSFCEMMMSIVCCWYCHDTIVQLITCSNHCANCNLALVCWNAVCDLQVSSSWIGINLYSSRIEIQKLIIQLFVPLLRTLTWYHST